MKQHILGLTLASLVLTPPLAAEDAHLTLERPIEFETLSDCLEAAEVLELMYRRFHVKPLAICEIQDSADPIHRNPHLSPEGGEAPSPGKPVSPPSPELLPFEREA